LAQQNRPKMLKVTENREKTKTLKSPQNAQKCEKHQESPQNTLKICFEVICSILDHFGENLQMAEGHEGLVEGTHHS